MNCAHPRCSGRTIELRCLDHGTLCSACGLPAVHSDKETRCLRCQAIARSTLCPCGSPWVHIKAYDSDVWLCKPCVYEYAEERGWNEDLGRAKALAEQERLDREKRHEEMNEYLKKLRTMQGRRKKDVDPGESLL